MKLFTYTFKTDKPKYIELAGEIASKIKDGSIKKNEQLPSKRALASHLGLSINTVLNAYNILLDEGYIYSVQKKGYFVANMNIHTIPAKSEISFKPTEAATINYNFKTSEVDSSLIPVNTFKKIYCDVLESEYFLKKSDYCGDYDLRLSIQRYIYETKGIEASLDQIIVSSGIDYMLTQILDITGANTISIENPGYLKISKILNTYNKKIVYTSVDSFGMTIPDKKVDLIYQTPYSQFPLGVKMSMERKKEFISYAKDNNSYIIEDSFDSDFKLTPGITTSLFSMSERVIYLESFSRSIAPSFRISFMVLPEKLAQIYHQRYKDFSNPVSTVLQMVIAKYIKSGDYLRHINRIRTNYRKKRSLIMEYLDHNKFEIISKESYLAIIVRPFNIPNNIKELLKINGIAINFISDFMYQGDSDLLMIGYSSIPLNKIKDGIKLLNSIF